MKALELTIGPTSIPFLKMPREYGLLQSFYDYIHTDAQKKPGLVDDKATSSPSPSR